MNISLKKKFSIIGIGSIGTLIILLMIETAFAQAITDFLIGNISDNSILLVIILGLFIFTLIISIIVGYFITEDINQTSVYKASGMSLLCLLIFLFIITNLSLFIYHRHVYQNIYGFEILWIFPEVLIYFSIYILGVVFNLFIIMILVYYVFFVIFLEKFFKMK